MGRTSRESAGNGGISIHNGSRRGNSQIQSGVRKRGDFTNNPPPMPAFPRRESGRTGADDVIDSEYSATVVLEGETRTYPLEEEEEESVTGG